MSPFPSSGTVNTELFGNGVLPDPEAIVIPLLSIEILANAPRKDYDQEQLQELVKDIQSKGILEPILVQKKTSLIGKPQKFILISGHRRLRAASQLGLQTIPARITHCNSEEETLAIQLCENVQRKDLHPIEIALIIRTFFELGFKEKEISERISKSLSWVSKYKKISKMPKQMLEDPFALQSSLSDLLSLESHFQKHSDLLIAWEIYKKEGIKVVLRATLKKDFEDDDKSKLAGLPTISRFENGMGLTREFLIVTKNQNVINCRMQVSESKSNDVRVIMPKQYSVEEIKEIFDKIIQSINTP